MAELVYSAPQKSQVTRSTIAFIMMTTFLNFVGLGIVNPVAPFIVGKYVPEESVGFFVALLLSIYSFSQFIAVPTLGALSDRFGRRPVLLLSLIGSGLGYLVYGIGGALMILFIGRMIDGLTGANVAIINAYTGDISSKEDRTRYFGLIGAASGFGFVVGPVLGGFIFRLTDSVIAPMYFAAAVTFLNTLWGVFALPESLPVEKRAPIRLRQMNPLVRLVDAFQLRHVRVLLASIFTWSFAFTVGITMYATTAKDRLGWSPDMIGMGYLMWGGFAIIVQMWLIRRLVPIFGELRLITAGLALMSLTYFTLMLVAWTRIDLLMWPAMLTGALGDGFIAPSFNGLVSKVASPSEQGRLQGGNQAMQSLSRVIAPVVAGLSYQHIGAPAPYLFGALMMLFCIIIVAWLKRALHRYEAN